MHFGWKILIPVALAWIVLIAIARGLRGEVQLSATQTVLLVGVPLGLLLLGLFLRDWRSSDRPKAKPEELELDESLADGSNPPVDDRLVSAINRWAGVKRDS
jgi:NADH-quinone oxidoreductase subunit H